MTAYSSTVDTFAGPFTAVVDVDGAVLASGWTAGVDTLVPLIGAALRPTSVAERPDLGPVSRAITKYHDGDLAAIDEIEVRQSGGEFMTHAWRVLRTVAPGKPVTYKDYAALAGRPAAVRAAAMACARNPVALFVPCHRVLRTDGTLGGFRWGLDAKQALLHHEAAVS